MDFAFNNVTQYSRCDSPETLIEHGCALNQIVNPQSSIRNLQAEPFFDAGEGESENIQLRPQEVEIFIRPS